MSTSATTTPGLLQAFDFEQNAVRILVRDEQPWFVAADVCRVLDLANSRDAISGLDDDEKCVVSASEANVGNADIRIPNRGLQFVTESGLYALVFKSRKPEAKRFRKWVTSEVIPTIRQTGSYKAEVPIARNQLAEIRELLITSARAVRDKGLDVGRAQQIANLAARYLETVKLEGDAIGYEAVLGVRQPQAANGILSGQPGATNGKLQAVPQRPLSYAAPVESEAESTAVSVEETLGSGEPVEGAQTRREVGL